MIKFRNKFGCCQQNCTSVMTAKDEKYSCITTAGKNYSYKLIHQAVLTKIITEQCGFPQGVNEIVVQYSHPTITTSPSYLLRSKTHMVICPSPNEALVCYIDVENYLGKLTSKELLRKQKFQVFDLSAISATLCDQVLQEMCSCCQLDRVNCVCKEPYRDYKFSTFGVLSTFNMIESIILYENSYWFKSVATRLTMIAATCGGQAYGGFVRDVLVLQKERFCDLDLFFPSMSSLDEFLIKCTNPMHTSGVKIAGQHKPNTQICCALDLSKPCEERYPGVKCFKVYAYPLHNQEIYLHIDLVVPNNDNNGDKDNQDSNTPGLTVCNDFEANALATRDGKTITWFAPEFETITKKSVLQVIKDVKSRNSFVLPRLVERLRNYGDKFDQLRAHRRLRKGRGKKIFAPHLGVSKEEVVLWSKSSFLKEESIGDDTNDVEEGYGGQETVDQGYGGRGGIAY